MTLLEAIEYFLLELKKDINRKKIFDIVDKEILKHVELDGITIHANGRAHVDSEKLKEIITSIIDADDNEFSTIKIHMIKLTPLCYLELRTAAAYAYAMILEKEMPSKLIEAAYYYRVALRFLPNLSFVRDQLDRISKSTGHSHAAIEFQRLAALAEQQPKELINVFIKSILQFIPGSKLTLEKLFIELNMDKYFQHNKPLIVKRLFDQMTGVKHNDYAKLDLSTAINKFGVENVIYLLAQIDTKPLQVTAAAADTKTTTADAKAVAFTLPTAISEAQKQQILINLLVSKKLDDKHIKGLAQQIKIHFPHWRDELHIQLIARLKTSLEAESANHNSGSSKDMAKKLALENIKTLLGTAETAASKDAKANGATIWNFKQVNLKLEEHLRDGTVMKASWIWNRDAEQELEKVQRALVILEPLRTIKVADHKAAPTMAVQSSAATAAAGTVIPAGLSGVAATRPTVKTLVTTKSAASPKTLAGSGLPAVVQSPPTLAVELSPLPGGVVGAAAATNITGEASALLSHPSNSNLLA